VKIDGEKVEIGPCMLDRRNDLMGIYIRQLMPRHSFANIVDKRILRISNIALEDSGNTYQCCSRDMVCENVTLQVSPG
jgi:hypothetical protein